MKPLMMLICLFLYGCGSGGGAPFTAPEISYTFFVAGHVYGHHSIHLADPDTRGFYAPFEEKIKTDIQLHSIKFGVLTGDIVYRSTLEAWYAIEDDIELLGIPIHMVPGNHDVADGELFTSRYGLNEINYREFDMGDDLFIILDGNLDNWSIKGKQFEFLEATLNTAYLYRNIFVFVHQVLWWESDNEYSDISVNSLAGRGETVNFWSEIAPLFNNLPNTVYMFAGDSGVRKEATPTHYQYDNIHMLTSGMGGGVNDNYLRITVHPDGNVEVVTVGLN